MNRFLIPVMAFLWLPQSLSAQAPKDEKGIAVESKIYFKKCNSAEISAIFGANTTGCLITDFKTAKSSVELEICGGLSIGVGGKVMSLGASLVNSTELCVSWTVTIEAKNKDDALTKLKSNDAKKVLLEKLKESLKSATDEQLKEYGLTREQIAKIEELKLEGNLKILEKNDADKVKKGLRKNERR